jgi:hypothetical protein
MAMFLTSLALYCATHHRRHFNSISIIGQVGVLKSILRERVMVSAVPACLHARVRFFMPEVRIPHMEGIR